MTPPNKSNEHDPRLIKSYVFHKDNCFFVSTINRESSSMYGGTYAETMVWCFDWATNERKNLIWQGEGGTSSINTHLSICKRLFETGIPDEPEES